MLEVDFDSTIISYEEILDGFWKNHNALRNHFYKGRQYISLLLYHDQTQKDIAENKKKEWEHILGGEIQTEITSYTTFYMAEDYHQKYYLKRFKKAVQTLNTIFSHHDDFVDSTLVARLNGFTRGYGTLHEIKEEIGHWILTPENKEELTILLSQIRW
ncbi:peptide-methionine (S)-S-oxide reductase [Texcoconibacillus texcoconensis]|uniref:peptide-methionine (S)-S-oxide reductase n=1 Tax=Texcoconibacillus texcoconensis TaxID=1095777 RepID=A0A840QUN4_9BACI|nr:peptide-methionine (S)-S-oxide reductase [Texcoconibacillus texcoconensis]